MKAEKGGGEDVAAAGNSLCSTEDTKLEQDQLVSMAKRVAAWRAQARTLNNPAVIEEHGQNRATNTGEVNGSKTSTSKSVPAL